jgi:glycosyltransferase involved in cell wall biosynthesis
MKILFIHQNFPGQFKSLAPALVEAGHEVRALTIRDIGKKSWSGVTVDRYALNKFSTKGVHPWVSDFESKTIRAEACFRAALDLRKQGYQPDLIIAHHGWGESLFLKEVWPSARLGIYCEWFYKTHGLDTGFDPEFPETDEGFACKLGLKNVNNILHMQLADAAISPTNWQASTFPEPFRSKIAIVHDGIDTDVLVPDPEVSLTMGNKIKLTRQDEIITFVNRNLEPYRGYHIFMRALPEILKCRPNARILIVGGDGKEGPSYGAVPDGGGSWKEIFKSEISSAVAEEDWARVHYSSTIPYQTFIKLLQLSTVHVYLTYPFILSWSLLEAMSVGCSIVASATPPVLEVIRDNDTGQLFDFFDSHGLADQVCKLLDDEAKRNTLGQNARDFVRSRYDLRTACLPSQINWIEGIA